MRLVVLISGGGRTLRNLLQRIEAGALFAKAVAVVSSAPGAKGLDFAREANIPASVMQTTKHESPAEYGRRVFDYCRERRGDLVVMAGFLKRVEIPADFEGRVVNIHPSLIPAFCGHGMYGHHVHEAVIAYGAKLSGCTVHFVDQEYDHGPILMQRAVPVRDDDTPETLAARVFAAECELYPEAIQAIAEGRVLVEDRKVIVRPAL